MTRSCVRGARFDRCIRALAAATAATTLVAGLPLSAQPPAVDAAVHMPPPRLDIAAPTPSVLARPYALRRAASTVALSMGNVGAVLTDADVLFYNPAMLTQARGMALSVQSDHPDATNGAIASAQTLGGLGLGVGARVATWRGTAPDMAFVRPSSRDLVTSSVALTAGAARGVGPVRVGLSATYAREAGELAQREHTTVDVAATLPFGPGNALNASVIVQHVGRAIAPLADDDAPWRTLLAFGGRNYPLATFWDLSAFTQLMFDADGTVRTAGGAELAWVPLEGVAVALRGGVRDGAPVERPYTAGVGVSLDSWSVDYALDPRRDGRVSHRIGVRIR
jgi:hypothetical protein